MNRKKHVVWVSLLALAAAISLGFRSAPAAGSGRAAADNKYIGADKCKSCHGSADTGDQYGHWKAMKHAKAFETLASEEAKKLAASKSIADPQKADECVRCHVTAFGVPEDQIKKGFDRTMGVQCEACHGPGEQHMKARFAAAAKSDAAAAEIPAGEIVTLPPMTLCVQCHNEQSPNYKPFCYHEFNAQIRHLNPKKARTTIDIGACTCPKCANGCPEEHKALATVK
jgi:cytochrome c553